MDSSVPHTKERITMSEIPVDVLSLHLCCDIFVSKVPTHLLPLTSSKWQKRQWSKAKVPIIRQWSKEGYFGNWWCYVVSAMGPTTWLPCTGYCHVSYHVDVDFHVREVGNSFVESLWWHKIVAAHLFHTFNDLCRPIPSNLLYGAYLDACSR